MINLQIWGSVDLSEDLVTNRASPFVALVAFVLAVSPGDAQIRSSAIDALLAGARCQASVRRQLEDWDGQFGAAMVEPAMPTGLRSARLPTSAMGIWLRVTEERAGELFVERITATRIERLRFDGECVGTEYAVAMSVPPPGAFTDSDLIARVARGGRGVFLLWSPHMPLSVDQHAVLVSVAGDLGLEVETLLDPGADADYAARAARERNLPASALRPLGGIELALRGMTTHTPSLQLFADGKLVGPVLYGYRNGAALRLAIGDTLARK
jgi:hypothetical protein